MTEALWLRSIDEARERTKASLIGASPSQREAAALQGKVTELTAALAESRARSSELEVQLLASLRERLELREQLQQLISLLKAEQELRAQDRSSAEARSRDVEASRNEVLAIARRRLGARVNGRAVTRSTKLADRSNRGKRKADRPDIATRGRHKPGRPSASTRARNQSGGRRVSQKRLRS